MLAVALATGRRSLVLAAVAIVMNLEGTQARGFAVESRCISRSRRRDILGQVSGRLGLEQKHPAPAVRTSGQFNG